jgi:hypothetical protein
MLEEQQTNVPQQIFSSVLTLVKVVEQLRPLPIFPQLRLEFKLRPPICSGLLVEFETMVATGALIRGPLIKMEIWPT